MAAELLARSGGRPVQRLFHGGARGSDAAIARAAHQLGWPAIALPAAWVRLQLAIAEALAHTSPMASTSVLVLAFPGGPSSSHASLPRTNRGHGRCCGCRPP